MHRIVKWIVKERLAESIIFTVVAPIMYVGVFYYYMNYYLNYLKTNGANPGAYNFDFASFSVAFGGFILVGGLLRKSSTRVQNNLIKSATGFLTSAVFSTIIVFIFPMGAVIKPELGLAFYLVVVILVISMILGVLGFTLGVSVLIPCLWKIGREDWKERWEERENDE